LAAATKGGARCMIMAVAEAKVAQWRTRPAADAGENGEHHKLIDQKDLINP
jgi:hypothetical protein